MIVTLISRIGVSVAAALALASKSSALCPDAMQETPIDALFLAFQTATIAQNSEAAAESAECLAERDLSALGYFAADATALRAQFANALADAGRQDEAVSMLERLAEEEGDPVARVPLLIQLSQIELDRNELTRAGDYADEAIAIAEAAADPALRAVVREPLRQRAAVDQRILRTAVAAEAGAPRTRLNATERALEAIDQAVLSRRRRLGLMGDEPTGDRSPSGVFELAPVFYVSAASAEATDEASFGQVMVSAPRAYAMATIPPRVRRRGEARGGGYDGALVQDRWALADAEAFSEAVRREAALFASREAIVFVADPFAGFENAIRTAGDLAHALEIEGAVILVWSPPAPPNANERAAFTVRTALNSARRALQPDGNQAARVHLIAQGGASDSVIGALEAIPGESEQAAPLLNTLVLIEPRANANASAPRWEAAAAQASAALLYRRTEEHGYAGIAGTPVFQTVTFDIASNDASGREIVTDPRFAAVLNDLRAVLWFDASAESRCLSAPVGGQLSDSASLQFSDGRDGCSYGQFRIAMTMARRLGVEDAMAEVAERIASGEDAEAWTAVRRILTDLHATSLE